MKNIRLLFLISIIVSLLVSCTFEKPTLNSSSGKTSELLVVIDKKTWEKSSIGDAIRGHFERYQYGLPQPEPIYNCANVSNDGFGDLLKMHRNILIIEKNPNLQKAKIEIRKNVWAQPQIVIKIKYPLDTSFFNIFNGKKDEMISYYQDVERKRIIRAYKKEEDASIRKSFEKKHKMSIVLPEGYYIAKEKDNFTWIRKETPKMSFGIIVDYFDYNDTSVFNTDNIIAHRDTITKYNIPGPNEGSYMIVSKVLPCSTKVIDIKGNYATETRGLWEVENNFMGGPFINYTIHDKINNRIVVLDAYVYNPNKPKRDYMKQLESIMYTIKFHKNKTELNN